ncbi:alpha/beta hydrolase [Actinomycetospora endophytica]|uniref:Alpha/beta hydrolase n=1 Tax=Actinomycetospora endophytica TaxID=2291215 RepID=A0ABS8P4A7_9PSEU|nr:alpha/beta hydrolase [Actinomycetospora endophytica]MCD2192236.1 alpha/beta hydrolase [Actinomycetospora endophytica]
MPTEPTRIDLPSEGGQTVAAFRWLPSGDPRGVVQLTHGMGEHVRRYDHLAGVLTRAGFLVQGQDHRGHGATAQANGTQPGSLGQGGWPALVDDVGRLVELGRQDFPGVPLILLGHSMGSFAVQQYLLDHSEDVDAAVLTGTTLLDMIEAGLDTSAEIDLSGFNAPFAPARTDFDWLSRDEAQVDAYVADPWCGFGLDSTAGTEMLTGGRAVADAQRLAAMRQDLPVYIAVGEHDPVGGPVVVAQALAERYRGTGLKDVTFRVWPGGRHEILNETNRDEVEGELLSWIEGAVRA